MVTYRQLVLWGNAHPDALLDLGDLAAGIETDGTASGRVDTLKRLIDALLPYHDSLLAIPNCDTMSFSDFVDDQNRLLFQVKQRAEWRNGLKAVVNRDLAWFHNAFEKIRTTLLLFTP